MGEIAKFLFAVLMFTLVFRGGRLNPQALFFGLIASQVASLWALIPNKTRDGL